MAKYYDLNIPGIEAQRRLDLASHNVLAFDGILDVPVTASDELITSAESYQILYAPNGGRGEMLMSIGGTYYRNFRLQSSGKTYLDSSWYNEDGQIRKDRLFLNGAARDIYAYAAGSFGKVERDGTDGITPHIDPTTKHWMVGTTDTGIKAEGTDGITPHIDPTTKHWMIGTQDTGIVAEAVDGKSAYEIWLENVTDWQDTSPAGFMAWMKAQADNYEGPFFAPSQIGVNEEGKVYYVPGESGGTGETYYVMIYYGGEAHTLATRSGLPSNFTSVYDISAATSNQQYATLSEALSAIPDDSVKKGGMSVKYIESTTNKYVQYQLKEDTFTTNTASWKKLVDESDFEDIELIDISGITAKNIYIYTDGKWHTGNNSKVVPIQGGKIYRFIPNGFETNPTAVFIVTPLTSSTTGTDNTSVTTFAGSYTNTIQVNGKQDIVMPDNATHLLVQISRSSNSVNCEPTIYKITDKYFDKSSLDSLPVKNSINPIKSGVVYDIAKKISKEIVDYRIDDYAIGASAYGTGTTGKHGVIEVTEGETYLFETTSNATRYALVTSDEASSGGTVHVVNGTSIMTISKTDGAIVTVPSGCSYLIFNAGSAYDVHVWKYLETSSTNDFTTKRIPVSLGLFNKDTGFYPVGNTSNYSGSYHTPKFIKNKGNILVHLNNKFASVILYMYNGNQAFTGRVVYSSQSENNTLEIEIPNTVIYYRLVFTTINGFAPFTLQYVDIDGNWNWDDDVFQKRPSDGYQLFTFKVEAIKCSDCIPVSGSTPTLNPQITITTDSGMLHLPESYKEYGEPTPLIIFIHGSTNNYKLGSNPPTEFPLNCPLAEEWAAAGYAQMDVDLIPDVYNDEYTNAAGGSSDDAECIIGAYKWAIEHFNIRRDGVYLIGRSRGAQAVLEVLGKYNATVLPVIAAISNAGAHSLLNYSITNTSSGGDLDAAAQWNLLCASYNIESDKPSVSGSNTLIRQDDIYNHLRDNINTWWKKACVAWNLLVENDSKGLFNNYPNGIKTKEQLLEFLHTRTGPNDADYLDFLKTLRFRSPVPLRFDWCVGDTTQPWGSNDGEGNYSKIIKDGFVHNPNGNAEYREWPSVDANGSTIVGASVRGHYHELYNKYDGDYTLPNGVVVTNPSMARVEWLEWCRRYDNRF